MKFLLMKVVNNMKYLVVKVWNNVTDGEGYDKPIKRNFSSKEKAIEWLNEDIEYEKKYHHDIEITNKVCKNIFYGENYYAIMYSNGCDSTEYYLKETK